MKKQKYIKLKEKYFKENGGLLLQKYNYNEGRVVGEGGYGIVYKGILADNKVVAIKKSKVGVPAQKEQFVNEIAAETAGALAYLHSSTSTPIIHRDVKAMNILLDDNYTVKVSDFGASSLVPLDQTQVTTLVQGTLGYLDPEYFHSNQLTQKSDVYSFGVVLMELLTSKVALSFARPEAERNLASFFVCSVEQGRLNQILDEDIVNEGNIETLKKVADLANRCLRVKREERPTMKHIAMELEGMMIMAKHPWGKANFGPEDTEYLLGSASMASVRGDNCSSTGTTTDATTVYDSMRIEIKMLMRHNGR